MSEEAGSELGVEGSRCKLMNSGLWNFGFLRYLDSSFGFYSTFFGTRNRTRASCLPGRRCAAELHPTPWLLLLLA